MNTQELARMPKAQLVKMARAMGRKFDDARTDKAVILGWLTGDQQPQQPRPTPAPAPADMFSTPAPTITPQEPALMTAPAAVLPAAVQTPTTASPAPLEAAAQLLGIVQSLSAGALDEPRVRSIIAEEVAKIERPAPVLVQVGELPARQLPEGEHRHPMFEKVLRLVAAGVNVLLVGPAGTGKTTLAHQVADALGLDFGALHCTAGASESQLLGWLLPSGENGRFEYRPARFAELYKAGNSLFLFDELDAADPNFLMVANGALANGSLHVPQNFAEPSIKRGERAYIMAAANTYGTGADMVYAGRNALDAATLDRFYVVHIDYDRELERGLTGRAKSGAARWTPASTDPLTVQRDVEDLADWLDAARTRAEGNKLRRVISTRAYIKARAARAAGVPFAEIQRDLLAGWTRDELAKVGAA